MCRWCIGLLKTSLLTLAHLRVARIVTLLASMLIHAVSASNCIDTSRRWQPRYNQLPPLARGGRSMPTLTTARTSEGSQCQGLGKRVDSR